MNFLRAFYGMPDRNNSGLVDTASQAALAGGQFASGQAQQQSVWAAGLSDEIMKTAREASGRDFTLADLSETNAADMWNRYRTLYQPIENQTVEDAKNYDSAAQMERVRQEAAGNVNSAYDTARASRAVELARMGVNPNSGRYVDPTSADVGRSAAVADTMNRATADRQDRAIMLRQGVAQFGTGISAAGDRAHEIALAATGQGTGVMNAAAGTGSALRTAPVAWTNAATAAYNAAGGIQIGQQNANTGVGTLQESAVHHRSDEALAWTKMGIGAGAGG